MMRAKFILNMVLGMSLGLLLTGCAVLRVDVDVYKGPLANTIHQLLGGVRSSMGYVGCGTIEELRTKPEFVQVTNAGMRESHVHDVTITKEAPNYQV